MKFYTADFYVDGVKHILVIVKGSIFNDSLNSVMYIASLQDDWEHPICLVHINTNSFDYFGKGEESARKLVLSNLNWNTSRVAHNLPSA